jgi:acetylornithine deacetylase/succinyl-diaminopimelate desuccinylase-like protein
MGNVHQPDEYMELAWLEPVFEMYAMITDRFLAQK